MSSALYLPESCFTTVSIENGKTVEKLVDRKQNLKKLPRNILLFSQIIIKKPILFQKGVVFVEMQNMHLAITSVPVQNWGELYDQDEALKTGTVFKDLDLPFFAAEQVPAAASSVMESLKSPEEKEFSEKMLEIQKISFVMDDLRLYLDTHPDEQEALTMLKDILKRRKQAMSEFASRFYPLTMDCMAELYEREPSSACYCWQKGAAPWEGVYC